MTEGFSQKREPVYREEVARKYQTKYDTPPFRVADKAVAKVLKNYISPSSLIVDVGCGDGDTLRKFLPQTAFPHYFGFDPSPEMLDIAKMDFPHHIFGKHFMEMVKLPDDYFDAALLLNGVPTYFLPENVQGNFRKLAASVKDYGIIAAMPYSFRLRDHTIADYSTVLETPDIPRLYRSDNEWREIFMSSGLVVREYIGFNFETSEHYNSNIKQRITLPDAYYYNHMKSVDRERRRREFDPIEHARFVLYVLQKSPQRFRNSQLISRRTIL